MIEEFTNLSGGIKKLSEKIDRGLLNGMGGPEKHEFTAFYHAAKELMYNGKKVIYQICEMSDTDGPFVLVPGYRMSEVYLKGKDFAVKVERVEEKEKKRLERVIKENIKSDCPVNFW